MPYISTRTLHHKSGFINKGGVVPHDYKRLNEGLKRGWIKIVGGPAATPPPVVTESYDERLTQPEAVSTEVIAPDEPPESDQLIIENLDYLMPLAKKSLAEEGILYIHQLAEWDVDELRGLRGIGAKLAERLLADYAEWKESFSEYVSPEDEDAESETNETDEDEGAEDD